MAWCHRCQSETDSKSSVYGAHCSACEVFYSVPCRNYHYGDMDLVRQCCVTESIYLHRLVRRVAITEHHPTARKCQEQWNDLTNAEMRLVMDTLEGEMPILKSDDELTYGIPVGGRMYPLPLAGR